MKTQKNIWDFYSICKKKLDRLHAKKLNQSRNCVDDKNSENDEVLNRSPLKRVNLRNQKKNKAVHSIGSSECGGPSRLIQISPIKLQPKLEIDNETRQIILRSNTIIDQTKSPIKSASCCKDDFIFKKPSSPAPRAKRQLDVSLNRKSFSDFAPKRCLESNNDSSPVDSKRFKKSINFNDSDQMVNNENAGNESSQNEFNVRKRLFDNNLDNVNNKNQTDSTGAFLNKLKDFQQKNSTSNRFNISFYSPSKRAKKRQDDVAKGTESINYSPKKYLENKLRNLSPEKSTNVPIKNLEPSKNLIPIKHFYSFSPPQKAFASVNLSSILTSPTKSAINSKISDLSLPDKYLKLTSAFDSLEVVISQLHNRSIACTFDKVKLNYQKLTKRDLDLKELAQIVQIMPSAYILKVNKSSADDENRSSLLLKPNIVSSKMIQIMLQIRSQEFKNRLLQFAKRTHDEFLLSLQGSKVLNSSPLKRWHPSFRFPDIPEAKLPDQDTVLSPKKGSLGEINKS